jgi:glutaredoxin 3
VSDAEATGGAAVLMYSTSWCGYCRRARELLRSKGVTFKEIDVDAEPALRTEMFERSSGEYTVPQIFIGGQHIGGADELQALADSGGLTALLAGR